MPTHALVHLAALDVRRRPDHRSELTSQLLMGEAVRVLAVSRDRAWWRIESLEDGYRGWARHWGLLPASRRRVEAWRKEATARVRVPVIHVEPARGKGRRHGPLFWNARVVPGPRRGSFRAIKLPDGTRGRVPVRALAVGGRPAIHLAKRVESLLGTPYLWGGRTPMGIDCSGLSQQLLAEQGLAVPRDADQQYRASRPLARGETPSLCDLVFFGPKGGRIGHVGVVFGEGVYVHSRGWVRVASLDRRNKMWDKELEGQWRGVRRPVLGTASRGGRSGPRRGESA